MNLLRYLAFMLASIVFSVPAIALQNASQPTKFPLCWGANAGTLYIHSIPTTSQIGIQNGAASLADGFPPLTFTPIAAGGVPPFGQDMNGILNQISCWSQWQNAGGTVPYDATFSTAVGGYPLNAILSASNAGNFWLSTTDNNTTNPDSGGAGWAAFSPVYAYVTDSGTANAGVGTLPYGISSLLTITGRPISIKKTTQANIGAYTLTLNSYTAAVHHADGTQLNSGDLPSSGIFTVIFDGIYFELQSPVEGQTLGTAASKNATSSSSSLVSSVIGSITNTHIPVFSDNIGTITDSGWTIGQLAPLNSPSLVGTPSSTTPATGDNSSRIATTAWWWNMQIGTQFSRKSWVNWTYNGSSVTITSSYLASISRFAGGGYTLTISPGGYSDGTCYVSLGNGNNSQPAVGFVPPITGAGSYAVQTRTLANSAVDPTSGGISCY